MVSKPKLNLIAATFAALAMTGPAIAAGDQQQNRAADGTVNWSERELQGGISLNRVVGMDVRGRNGESFGEVQHVIVNSEGRIAALVVDAGGFMNIGDRHYRIPFEQVQFSRDMDHVVVPVTRQNEARFRDRRVDEQVRTSAGEYRVSRLKDGAFWLRDGTRAGQVEDLIASRNGQIRGVVVDTDLGPGGLTTVPFAISRFDFERGTYNAGFDRNDTAGWGPWDYGRNNVAAPRERVGASGAAAGGGAVGGRSTDERGMRTPRADRG